MVPHVPSRVCRPMDIIRFSLELAVAKSGDMAGNPPDQFVKCVYIRPMCDTQAIRCVYDWYVDLGIWEGCLSCQP